MSDLIHSYNCIAENVEKGFNTLGVMPLGVPFISGQLRALAGAVQKAAGLPMMLLGAIAYATTSLMDCTFDVCAPYKKLMLFGAELLAHGFLNIFRGTLEATISLVTAPLLGIGNLALIPFNRLHFYQPIFSYGSFTRDVIHIPSYTIEVY